jgi:ATP-dependent Clp protease protease subunit
MNLGNEFRDYAIKHMGITSMEFFQWGQIQDRLYGANASLTPYILEERELRATQIDIFSRMMMDRIIWLAGPVNDRMSTVVQAQLMFLDNLETKDITLHIDSPGGSVKSGLSIVDVMDYVSSDKVTINTGMAASMGSILLGAGTKGKRHSLRFSKVMIHQVSSGAYGHYEDMKISMAETEKYNKILFGLLGEYTNKTPEQILTDSNRDMWLTAEEALAYGIIDNIITKKASVKK